MGDNNKYNNYQNVFLNWLRWLVKNGAKELVTR